LLSRKKAPSDRTARRGLWRVVPEPVFPTGCHGWAPKPAAPNSQTKAEAYGDHRARTAKAKDQSREEITEGNAVQNAIRRMSGQLLVKPGIKKPQGKEQNTPAKNAFDRHGRPSCRIVLLSENTRETPTMNTNNGKIMSSKWNPAQSQCFSWPSRNPKKEKPPLEPLGCSFYPARTRAHPHR